MIFGHPKYTNEKLVKLCVNGKILGLMSRRRSRRRRSTNNSVLTFIHLVALLDSQLWRFIIHEVKMRFSIYLLKIYLVALKNLFKRSTSCSIANNTTDFILKSQVVIFELFCNGHFVLEFGQFISVTWLNLLRRLGFGQTPPPVGTPAQIWVFFKMSLP